MSYRTDTKALVLAVLKDGPKHGYAIGKAIRELSQDVLKLGEGQLYPILHELEERGWVEGNWEIQDGDPPRKVYAITESGLTELAERSKRWSAFSGAVASVLNASTLNAQVDAV
ncbi:MAG TPA: helix-turn-helix transcriptional regulator [Fimbriimonadaceae bacterium]|jgi:DNA-binding PadR family transcriptional regulator